MNLKQILKFYGTHPENFDAETQKWLDSTPKNELRTTLQNYRAKVGIEYYNMNLDGVIRYNPDGTIGVDSESLSKKGNPLRAFYLKYIGGPIDYHPKRVGLGVGLGVEEVIIASILLIVPQDRYKTIVDKAMSGVEMSTDEINQINDGISGGGIFQEFNNETKRYILTRRAYFAHYGIIRALYEFVLDVSSERVKPKRCESIRCSKIFIPNPKGSEQKYCGNTCKVWAYRSRKRLIAV